MIECTNLTLLDFRFLNTELELYRFPVRLIFWPQDRIAFPAESLPRMIPRLKNLVGMATLSGMSKVHASTAQETDEELATLAARRDPAGADLKRAKDAFSLLYLRHSRLLRAFLSSRILRSELDDIEQGIWERVWQRLPEGFQGGNFRAWLHQISRNYLVDFWRKSRPDELPEAYDSCDASTATPDSILIDREQMATLESCLSKLTDPMAAIVRGRLKGESYEDLCDCLGIENARAQKLLFTAKQLLQTCVEGGGK